ncbi:MAG: hypothetical protein GY828_04225 [Candidatus Gracilibacteria bacterium]|nr:hypothetical protein [Candidatus Gracilibacteria bacterium]
MTLDIQARAKKDFAKILDGFKTRKLAYDQMHVDVISNDLNRIYIHEELFDYMSDEHHTIEEIKEKTTIKTVLNFTQNDIKVSEIKPFFSFFTKAKPTIIVEFIGHGDYYYESESQIEEAQKYMDEMEKHVDQKLVFTLMYKEIDGVLKLNGYGDYYVYVGNY